MSEMKLIFFDFDGTIADSLEMGYTLFQSLAEKYHVRKLKDFAEYQQLLTLSLNQIIWKYKMFPWRLRRIVNDNKQKGVEDLLAVSPFPGISDAIKTLAQNYTLVIVSSSLTFAIEAFLKKNNLDQYFQEILGADKGRDKRSRMRRVLRKNGLQPTETVMIGDSVRDIKDSHDVGVHCIGVTYGIHSHEMLQTTNPCKLVDKPSEIPDAVLQITQNCQTASHSRKRKTLMLQ